MCTCYYTYMSLLAIIGFVSLVVYMYNLFIIINYFL